MFIKGWLDHPFFICYTYNIMNKIGGFMKVAAPYTIDGR